MKLETGWKELLDVVCYEPWVRLQIERDNFRYAESGLLYHGSKAKRFLALVVAFNARCDTGAAGPGIRLLFDGKPETRQRMPNERIYENLFQWRLTLRLHGV